MYGKVWKGNVKTIPEILSKGADYAWYRVPIMHGIEFGKVQISFNHQRTSYVRIFTVPVIFEVWLPDYNIS